MRSRRGQRFMPVLESEYVRSRPTFPLLWIAAALAVAVSWVPTLTKRQAPAAPAPYATTQFSSHGR